MQRPPDGRVVRRRDRRCRDAHQMLLVMMMQVIAGSGQERRRARRAAHERHVRPGVHAMVLNVIQIERRRVRLAGEVVIEVVVVMMLVDALQVRQLMVVVVVLRSVSPVIHRAT